MENLIKKFVQKCAETFEKKLKEDILQKMSEGDFNERKYTYWHTIETDNGTIELEVEDGLYHIYATHDDDDKSGSCPTLCRSIEENMQKFDDAIIDSISELSESAEDPDGFSGWGDYYRWKFGNAFNGHRL